MYRLGRWSSGVHFNEKSKNSNEQLKWKWNAFPLTNLHQNASDKGPRSANWALGRPQIEKERNYGQLANLIEMD